MSHNNYKGLIKAVEKQFGRKVKVHSDFDELSIELKSMLSSTTLKRVWGYNRDHKMPSERTIDILAQYVGYDDYKSFLQLSTIATSDYAHLYNASRVASLVEKLHTERADRAYELISECRYRDAQEILGVIEDEVKVLEQSAQSIAGSAEAMASELYITATAIWHNSYSDEDVYERIDAILQRAYSLANTINHHTLLWLLLHSRAYYALKNDLLDQALKLFDEAILQARISMLEDPEGDPTTLLLSINDKTIALILAERYEEADQTISESDNYIGGTVESCYLLLNKIVIDCHFERDIDPIAQWDAILSKMEEWHRSNAPINESVFLQAICHYNKGVYYCNTLDESALAITSFKSAVERLESRQISTSDSELYYENCVAFLEELEEH